MTGIQALEQPAGWVVEIPLAWLAEGNNAVAYAEYSACEAAGLAEMILATFGGRSKDAHRFDPAVGDHELAAWQEILDGAKTTGRV